MPRRTLGGDNARELEQALNRLDLATETLEGLDELGVTTREDLIALMDALEAEIDEEAELAF